jgi:hypothetical protein
MNVRFSQVDSIFGGHRNLSTGTSMFALVQQTFLVKKPCKKSDDLHPRQGNLLQRNIFTGINSVYNTKYVGDQLKKIRPFFNMHLQPT